MPRNGSGVLSAPAGTLGTPNTVIESAKYNAFVNDWVSDGNAARPITAGGTGGITAIAGADNLSTKGTDIASATTTDIGAATGRYVHITGTTTITGLGTKTAGVLRIVTFDGALTLTHNATTLILPGAANIVTAAGDVATFVSEGGGNWRCVSYSRATGGSIAGRAYVTKSGNYTGLDADYEKVIRFSAAATYSIDVTANLRTNWYTEVWADGGAVTVDPNSTDTVNGAATLFLQQGQRALIFKTAATTFQANITSDALSGPQLQGYSTGLALTTNATDATNDVDIAVGSAASDTSPYYLMQLTSALVKRIDASWAVGTNQGGLDTGSVGNNTYYIWLIQRSDTGVTDVLFSLSSTAPTMPTNYDRKRLIGLLDRASATNSAPYLNAKSIGNTGLILLSKRVLPTAAATDFSIPSGVKRVILSLNGFTTNGTSIPVIQLKASGTAETSGYDGSTGLTQNGAGIVGLNSNGMRLTGTSWSATSTVKATATITQFDGNTWKMGVQGGFTDTAITLNGEVTKSLSAVLDGIRITTTNGTDAVDGGSYALYVEY